ncbi:MAG: ATP-binding protein [Myxococcota bacterium]
MDRSELTDLLACLPQAAARVDAQGQVLWVASDFGAKTGLTLEAGQRLAEALEPSVAREELERAIAMGAVYEVVVVTCALRQMRARVRPAGDVEGVAWVVFEPAGLDDDAAFARALQEIGRALAETLDVDAVCASAVLAMVRCAQVSRAEVYLVEERRLRRVAASDLAEPRREAPAALPPGAFQQAVATGEPELGVTRTGSAAGMMFAAVPLSAQRRTVGLLVLYKDAQASFSVRELDLWSAAAAQLAVAVENARLLKEAQSALRVRDEFMSIASHELKTPLTPLKMCLSLMERRIAQGQDVELATVIKSKRQVDRLAGLVNELLDASKLELGQLSFAGTPLELSQVLADVVDEFRLASEREFHLTLPREPVWVRGDRARLEQVVVNLLENAHKYSAALRPVVVRLEATRVEAFARVEDAGIGIPAADQGRVFERFCRARNSSHRHFGGLGLGLFISRSIARLHGGELTVRSVEGKGSTFTVALPRMSEAEVRARSPRILVVDEDGARLGAAEQVLRLLRFEVWRAADGVRALEAMGHAPVDAVVLSGSLPYGELFAQTLSRLPWVRPVPLVLLGGALPSWAPLGGGVFLHAEKTEALGEAVTRALSVGASQMLSEARDA